MKRFTKTLLLVALLGVATPTKAYDLFDLLSIYMIGIATLDWAIKKPKQALSVGVTCLLCVAGATLYEQYQEEKERYAHPPFLDQNNSCLPDAVKQRDETVITRYSAKIEVQTYNRYTKTYTVTAPTFEQFKAALETQCKAPAFTADIVTIVVYPAVTFKETDTQQTGPIKIKKTKTVYLQAKSYTQTDAFKELLTTTQAALFHTLQQFLLDDEKLQIVFLHINDLLFKGGSGTYNITKNSIELIND